MIKVDLIANSNVNPLDLASHAAKMCYQAEPPEWGKNLDVENRLFKTGHHTTLEHFFFTFMVEGIAVGDITLGMHLAHPFYNTDQRSGRYCAKMFLEPDFAEIENYIKNFWPELNDITRSEIMEYIKSGVGIYHANIEKAGELAKNALKEERPFVNDDYLTQNSPKIAQEQMRMFIPVIFPTGMDFTINLAVLAAMYESAWSPAMRYVTNEMVNEVIKKFPELAFAFNKEKVLNKDWAPKIENKENSEIKKHPSLKLLNISEEAEFSVPTAEILHPVDKLHFLPEMMNNSIGEIKTEIEISLATMGQDQRHRTIRRGEPVFTGNFYLPPIPAGCGLEEEAKKLINNWKELSKKIPETLSAILAPYGAMLKYIKSGSFNAIAHEQGKRLCFCAQEEIYHIGRLMREAIVEAKGESSSLLKIFEPPCFSTNHCIEGARYCGRDINLKNKNNYFPKRKV